SLNNKPKADPARNGRRPTISVAFLSTTAYCCKPAPSLNQAGTRNVFVLVGQKKKEDSMSATSRGAENRPAAASYAEANPQLYAFLDWMAQQDPEYVQAFQQYTAIGTGEGRALSVKYREMIMTAILVFTGRREGAEAHLKRAIEHGATKRELFE